MLCMIDICWNLLFLQERVYYVNIPFLLKIMWYSSVVKAVIHIYLKGQFGWPCSNILYSSDFYIFVGLFIFLNQLLKEVCLSLSQWLLSPTVSLSFCQILLYNMWGCILIANCHLLGELRMLSLWSDS